MATTFCETTSARFTAAVALSLAGMAKCGSGLPELAASRISAKVWPEPASSLSACAGLIVTASFSPRVSSIAGSARLIDGMNRARDARSQGISMFLGFGC